MIVLASKTGWTEWFIRWGLPLSKGWSYYHAARLLEGERCRWPGGGGAVDGWLDRVRERLEKSR